MECSGLYRYFIQLWEPHGSDNNHHNRNMKLFKLRTNCFVLHKGVKKVRPQAPLFSAGAVIFNSGNSGANASCRQQTGAEQVLTDSRQLQDR
jgi:hypothetical protein